MLSRIILGSLCAILLSSFHAGISSRGASGDDSKEVLLVVNAGEDTLSFISLPTLTVIRKLPTREHPQDIVLSPDRSKAYVAEMGAEPEFGNKVAEVDAQSGKVLRRIDLGANHQPHLLALSHDGKRLWAACAPQQAIVEVSTVGAGDLKVWKTLQAGSYMFVLTPDENKIYVANFDAGTVTVIDRRDSSVRNLTIGGKPIGIDASPKGREVWVSNLEKNNIVILDTATDQVAQTISSEGQGPARLKFSPDGKQVIVTESHSNQVVVFDAVTRELLKKIPTGRFPKGLLISRDGRFAFVSEMEDGNVAQIELASGKTIHRVKTGASPEGLAMSTR
jgi:YVTN family beta-propeller protein